MGNALRVGVVGVGRIGVHHARSLLAVADVAELVVADADPARAEIVARELGASAAAPAALIESAPDALVISTPTPTHAPLLRLAAEAGIPTFCEKPVALELAVLDDVAAEVEATGTLVQV